ncbi:RidA family protein [Paractinoplanes hotanensis]|uniref:RidA family protein n=1 Tax=Paractinoplanes hotanensis TaxID=2906497 RepID=UPI003F68D063
MLTLLLPRPGAAAAYESAVRDGGLIITSGHLPLLGGALPATGKVGSGPGSVDPMTARRLARRCALNALAAVAELAGGLDRVDRVVKMTGYVASEPGFTGQPEVVDGASLLLRDVFGEAGRHARSAIGVAALPRDAPVEVELTVRLSP